MAVTWWLGQPTARHNEKWEDLPRNGRTRINGDSGGGWSKLDGRCGGGWNARWEAWLQTLAEGRKGDGELI